MAGQYNYQILVNASLAAGSGKKLQTELNNKVKLDSKATSGMKQLNKETGLFNQNLADVGAKVIQWSLITGVIFGTVRAIKEGIQSVTELNSALVELKKVTNLNNQEMAQFVSLASDAGTTVARTTSEIVQGASDFARAGYEAQAALDLSKQAAMFVNIGDGIENVTEATSAMIAVMKGFKLEASDMGHILDVINEVSNNFAVDSKDLADGVKRVSATLESANNTFEESIGLITGITEVIRDSGRASTGIRTIALRLRGMSDDGEDLADNTAKLEDEFNQLGLTLFEVDGSFKSTYDILQDLSGEWDGLSDTVQASLTMMIAGIRRSDILTAALSNMGSITGATETALNSLGSAVNENAIYMDSIAAKTALFKKELQDLWISAISSDSIKTIVDLGTELLQVIDKVGLLSAILPILGLALGGVTGGIVALIASGLIYFLDEATVSMQEQQEIVAKLTTDIGLLTSEIKGLQELESPTAGQKERLKLIQDELAAKKEIYRLSQITLAKKGIEGDGTVKQFSQRNLPNLVGDSNPYAIETTFGADKVIAYRKVVVSLATELQDLEQSFKSLDPVVDSEEWVTAKNKIDELKLSLNSFLSEGLLYSQEILGYFDILKEEVPSDIQQSIDALQSLFDMMINPPEPVVPQVVEQLEGEGDAPTAEEEAAAYEKLALATQEVTNQLSVLSSVQQDLNESQAEGADGIAYALRNYEKLAKAGVDVQKVIKGEMSLRQAITRATLNQTLAYIQGRTAMMAADATYLGWSSAQWAIFYSFLGGAYGQDFKNFVLLNSAKSEDDAGLLRSMAANWAAFYDLQMQEINAVEQAALAAGMDIDVGALASSVNELERVNKLMASFAPDLYISSMGDIGSAAGGAADNIKDLNKELEKAKTYLEQIDAILAIRLHNLDQIIDAKKQELDVQEELTALDRERLELEKLRLELANTQRERNVRLYTETGWQWVADPREIRRIEGEIADQETNISEMKQDAEHNQQIALLEAESDAINDMQDAFGLLDDKIKENIKTWEQLINAISSAGIAFSQGSASLVQGLVGGGDLGGSIVSNLGGGNAFNTNPLLGFGAVISQINNLLATPLAGGETGSGESQFIFNDGAISITADDPEDFIDQFKQFIDSNGTGR